MPSARQQPRQIGLAQAQRQRTQIVTIEGQDVERIELHFIAMLVRKQLVEIGNAINPEDDGLTIDHELPMAILGRRLDDPRVAVSPVVAAVATFAEYDPDNR